MIRSIRASGPERVVILGQLDGQKREVGQDVERLLHQNLNVRTGQAGVVISASHNPFDDNGIKFFSGNGMKLPDEVELAIEAELDNPMQTNPSDSLGKAKRIDDAVGRYIRFSKSTFPADINLRGLKIVVDSAHGATYHIARHVFHELGADVIAIGAQPDGKNINDGYGATAPANLRSPWSKTKHKLVGAARGRGSSDHGRCGRQALRR